MTSRKYFAMPFVLFLAALLIGCVTSSRPTNNVDFEPITDLHQLAGIYRNQGEFDENSDESRLGYIYYLSVILWPDKKLDHAAIKTIEVRIVGEKQLSVKAYAGRKLVQDDVYVEGEDFSIDSGRILVKRELGLGGEGAAGPTYESAELGLDLLGHGKYKRTEGFAGIVYLIPIAYSHSTEVRFVRIAR